MTGYSKNLKIQYGDFQTPENFTHIVCNYLNNTMPIAPTAILEPTCGLGNFLITAKEKFMPTKMFGIEKNADYYSYAKKRLGSEVILFNEDLFNFLVSTWKCNTF